LATDFSATLFSVIGREIHCAGSHDGLARIRPRDSELSISDEVLIYAASSDQAKRCNVKLTFSA
jgi:hypothetical protein